MRRESPKKSSLLNSVSGSRRHAVPGNGAAPRRKSRGSREWPSVTASDRSARRNRPPQPASPADSADDCRLESAICVMRSASRADLPVIGPDPSACRDVRSGGACAMPRLRRTAAPSCQVCGFAGPVRRRGRGFGGSPRFQAAPDPATAPRPRPSHRAFA